MTPMKSYDEEELEMLNRVSDITFTDYEIRGNEMPDSSLLSMIQDLLLEVEHLKEEIEDIKKDREDNYKAIPTEEQIGYNNWW